MAPRNQNKRNPYNPDNRLYKRLTRLFSGPIVNYNQQNIRKSARHELDKYEKTFRSASGQHFKKKAYNSFDNVLRNLSREQARSDRYRDFNLMEHTPELASALDIYADEITTHTKLEQILRIKCQNQEIQEILHTLFYKILNVESNLFGWARTMCKYGDFYLYLDIEDDKGIKSVIGLPPSEVERMEGEDKDNPNYVQFQWNSAGMTLENWQISHFRVLGNDKFAPYGTSVLDPARRIWRQLTLMEDAMMAYRIVRAPDRRVFYIDVGGIPNEDVEQTMEAAMTQMKRHRMVDTDNGNVDLRYNAASIEEDFFIPVRGGQSGTKIESITGQSRANDIEDVKYLRDKMVSAIKIPQSYLARGEGAEEDKGSLAQKDVRFARTIQRLQRSMISELEKMAVVHLYTMGYRGNDLINFDIDLNNPSKIAQMQEMEQMRIRLEIATQAKEFFSRRWISENVFDISPEEFQRNLREITFDRKLEGAYAKMVELAGNEGAFGTGGPELGGDLGLMGPELGGDLGQGLEGEADLGGLGEVPAEPVTSIEPETGEPPPSESDSVLLPVPEPATSPGSRDDNYKLKSMDGLTTTEKSKGKWYRKVDTDKRSGMAPRRKNYTQKRQGGHRSTLPGYLDMKQTASGTLLETKSIYDADNVEGQIFGSTDEIKSIIESLKKKTEKENEV